MIEEENTDDPQAILASAEKDIQEIIKRVIKKENEHLHKSAPRINDDFVHIIEEVITDEAG